MATPILFLLSGESRHGDSHLVPSFWRVPTWRLPSCSFLLASVDMATPLQFLLSASSPPASALFIAIPSTRMPHSSLFLPLLHTPTPLSSFLSSTHTNRLPHFSLFLLLLPLNTLLLLPTPSLADLCPRGLHASDSPSLSWPTCVHVRCTQRTPHSALFLRVLHSSTHYTPQMQDNKNYH